MSYPRKGERQISELTNSIVDPVLAKRAGINTTLLGCWDEIAGDDAPETQLSASQLRQLVATLLERLTVPRDREVLSRFYLQEQDKADVCRALGIDSEHFHRVVHRARGRFRDMLFEAGIRSS